MLNNKQLHANLALHQMNEDLLEVIERLTQQNAILRRNNEEYDADLEVTHQICCDLEEAAEDVIEQNKHLKGELYEMINENTELRGTIAGQFEHGENVKDELNIALGILHDTQSDLRAKDRALRMARGELEALRKRSCAHLGGRL